MNTTTRTRLLYIGADYAATVAGLILFSLCRFMFVPGIQAKYPSIIHFLHSHGVGLTLLIFPPLMLLLSYLTGYYVRVKAKSRVDELLRTLSAVVVATIIFFFVALLNDRMPMRRHHYELTAMFAACLFLTVWPMRFIVTSMLRRAALRQPPAPYVMICPAGEESRCVGRLDGCGARTGFVISAVCPTGEGSVSETGLPAVSLDKLPPMIAAGKLRGVVLAPSALATEEFQRLLHTLYDLDVPVMVSPDDRAMALGNVTRYDHIIGEPLIDITRPQLPDAMVAVKRFIDVVVSASALLVTSPLILTLGIAVKLQSPGPVFYSQERIGYRRRPFMIHKLRSMVADSEAAGPQLSSDTDPRITPVGRFMRKYRLDELPNLWNVLVGEMSLVGPRPEREYFIRRIVERAPHYTLLHLVRPGLTSWGMVRYGYASTVDEMVERLRYDILYIQNLSLEVDIKILIYTLRTVVRGEGK